MHLTCAALQTSRLRLGPGVTNPLARHPIATASAILALDEASDGRADLVAGTGYRSAYIIGKKAATLATMKRVTHLWRSIFKGDKTELGGLEINLLPPRPTYPFTSPRRVPGCYIWPAKFRRRPDHGRRLGRHPGLGPGTG